MRMIGEFVSTWTWTGNLTDITIASQSSIVDMMRADGDFVMSSDHSNFFLLKLHSRWCPSGSNRKRNALAHGHFLSRCTDND
jgi:hypothetical protein